MASARKPVRVSQACLLVAGIAGAGSLLLLRGFRPRQLPNHLPAITVDYPSEGSIFPPEITPPTFLWRDPSGTATSTLHGCRSRGRVVEGRKFTRDSYGTDSIIERHERRGFRLLFGLGTAIFLYGTLFSLTKGLDRIPDLIIFVTAAALLTGALLVGQLPKRAKKTASEWRSGPLATMIVAIELILCGIYIDGAVVVDPAQNQFYRYDHGRQGSTPPLRRGFLRSLWQLAYQ